MAQALLSAWDVGFATLTQLEETADVYHFTGNRGGPSPFKDLAVRGS
jgi:hypothetical protein